MVGFLWNLRACNWFEGWDESYGSLRGRRVFKSFFGEIGGLLEDFVEFAVNYSHGGPAAIEFRGVGELKGRRVSWGFGGSLWNLRWFPRAGGSASGSRVGVNHWRLGGRRVFRRFGRICGVLHLRACDWLEVEVGLVNFEVVGDDEEGWRSRRRRRREDGVGVVVDDVLVCAAGMGRVCGGAERADGDIARQAERDLRERHRQFRSAAIRRHLVRHTQIPTRQQERVRQVQHADLPCGTGSAPFLRPRRSWQYARLPPPSPPKFCLISNDLFKLLFVCFFPPPKFISLNTLWKDLLTHLRQNFATVDVVVLGSTYTARNNFSCRYVCEVDMP